MTPQSPPCIHGLTVDTCYYCSGLKAQDDEYTRFWRQFEADYEKWAHKEYEKWAKERKTNNAINH